MKKFSLLVFILCLCANAVAQESDNNDKKYALTTVNNDIGIASLRILDNYLSPLEYDGLGVKLQTEKRKFFSVEKTNLSRQEKIGLTLGTVLNPAQSAGMTYLALNYSWGMHYHFRPAQNLQLLSGGLIGGNLGNKINSRNVNNPTNIDLYLDLSISGLAIWDVSKSTRLQVSLDIPVAGTMFVPPMGASYFEMFGLGNFSNTGHFSSFHNKMGINQKYSVFFTLKRSVININYAYNYLKYEANNMIFKNNQSVFSIGWSYYLRTFAGKRNEAPLNFIKY